jgi:hypothetical protein
VEYEIHGYTASHRTNENAEKVWNLESGAFRQSSKFITDILKHLCQAVHRKWPELWPDWILHHDSGTLCQAVSGTKIDY